MLNIDKYEKIFYYKDVLKNSDEIVRQIENLSPEWEFWSTKPSNDEPYKMSSYEFADYKPVKLEILDIVAESYIRHYSKQNNLTINKITDMVVNKYYPGKHMGDHSDSHKDINSPLITVMINLNNDYEGGELAFKKQNLTLKPEPGSILIYPSIEPYSHTPGLILQGSKICCTIFGYGYENN